MPDNKKLKLSPLERLKRDVKEAKADAKKALENAVWEQDIDITNLFGTTYFDSANNTLEDGYYWDSMTCANGAQPTEAQIRTALSKIERKDPISETSTARTFDDINPIADACNIAPRPAKGR